MRKPKWTEQQVHELLRSMRLDRSRAPLSAEEREELDFCVDYHSNTPEAKAAQAKWAKESAAEADILNEQCLEVAREFVAAGQTAILRCLDDPQTHPWVKFYVVASHQYTRPVINRVLADPNLKYIWPMLWHPEVTNTDLERLIVDERCSEYLRGEIAARIASVTAQHPLCA